MDADKDGPQQIGTPNYLQNMMFRYYKKEIEVETKEFTRKNPDLAKVNLNILQALENSVEIGSQIFHITDFYNRNYTGNKDFIHIPTLSNTFENAMKYPIIFATKKNTMDNNDLLGVTTIKFENNQKMTDNPYFPTVGENVLSITGILTKSNTDPQTRIRGIGKLLFKAAIRGAYYIRKKTKIRLICEADCRNQNSIKAVVNAVKELQEEAIPVQLAIKGYYEIINVKNQLKEAPTFVLEVDLTGKKQIDDQSTIFSYSDCEGPNLLKNLSNIIRNNTKELKRFVTIQKDIIIYHEIKPINALNVKIEIGNSAEGNNRIPSFTNVYKQVETY